MCFAGELLNHRFQVFFCLKEKAQCFGFLYKGKDFNLKKNQDTNLLKH